MVENEEFDANYFQHIPYLDRRGNCIRQLNALLDRPQVQEELAERLHVSRQTVSNYETGRSRPDVDMLLLAAEKLEVDVQVLLYGEPVQTQRRREVYLLLAEGAATVLFAAAAVVFILVGGGLLFFTLRAGLQNWKKGGPDSSPDDDKE